MPTLTPDYIKELLSFFHTHAPYPNTVLDDQTIQDIVKALPEPPVKLEVDDLHAYPTSHLSTFLRDIENNSTRQASTLETLATEAQKTRQILEDLKNAVQNLYVPAPMDYSLLLTEIRDAILSVADVKLLAMTSVPEHLETVTTKILQALNRRPELREALKAKLRED